ncbi:MAG: hypothetical protein IT229_11880 [Flavobacteriales bacterium]|nr:hypothetical protein [Flavobacteriales bacterium]
MTNATILQVHGSPDHFPVVETDQGFFEMRYGGVLRLKGMPNGAYTPIAAPFLGRCVQEVLTDDHWVYLITRSGAIISHGPGWISGDGATDLAFFLKEGPEAAELLAELRADPEMRRIELA